MKFAKWRSDPQFVALARRRWPADLRAADNPNYPTRRIGALTRLRLRHEGFRATEGVTHGQEASS